MANWDDNVQRCRRERTTSVGPRGSFQKNRACGMDKAGSTAAPFFSNPWRGAAPWRGSLPGGWLNRLGRAAGGRDTERDYDVGIPGRQYSVRMRGRNKAHVIAQAKEQFGVKPDMVELAEWEESVQWAKTPRGADRWGQRAPRGQRATYLTVVPAYGRDYKSQAALTKDWAAGKDFLINDMSSRWDGKPINKQDADQSGITVNVRYDGMRKILSISPSGKR